MHIDHIVTRAEQGRYRRQKQPYSLLLFHIRLEFKVVGNRRYDRANDGNLVRFGLHGLSRRHTISRLRKIDREWIFARINIVSGKDPVVAVLPRPTLLADRLSIEAERNIQA